MGRKDYRREVLITNKGQKFNNIENNTNIKNTLKLLAYEYDFAYKIEKVLNQHSTLD
ncbi:hypothetical protein KTC96_24590 (plasmid) [Clostridium estertheticum]|uniref:hypothetical protein n=1 Tax=Clostridium estertheticum TaxID=238834 RepID=UPI001C7CBB25|nr:hypothetical protein [Clostridium estertheticum]MBX4259706.1 hypothetical protein [Clostridium estertheticum]WLC73293.1 hypothetical protein KTC96_24590 [Clostridium estertheticum]